ncbi:glycosyltransferase [Deminuibacter soli]|uniref:Glycosyltransferase n=1 Tax=Deminuibacter soli TaxID=2291815 RepID=A0A3E1NGF0_9BACT|nr:nucleotide disphospho-sugar-binding domain-containing protein [Deminuibacter soli]RFM27035.1 glycosyltransferase [Deminuibacter soli]
MLDQVRQKKVLFATVPADGHFNPLTGLAKYLQQQGWEVKWYTSGLYQAKLGKLGIPHLPFKKALDANGSNVDSVFPKRTEIKSKIAKLNFDLIHIFSDRAQEYYEDIREIYRDFRFDLMIADSVFSAIPIVKAALAVPVVAVGIVPLPEKSRYLAPYGLGMTPPGNFLQLMKYRLLHLVSHKILFKESIAAYAKALAAHGVQSNGAQLFDVILKHADLVLQSGSPAFEYRRPDMGRNIEFVGALHPYQAPEKAAVPEWFNTVLHTYKKIVLVTQGTVEKDYNKLIKPTVDALKDTDTLVIVTTGGSNTTFLRARYPYKNVIVEDFVPYDLIMPHVSVFVTNGGYGGVLLSIKHQLPIVAAGMHEGKNEICARVGYFNIGIDLETESPDPVQVREAVQKVINDAAYKKHIKAVAADLEQYEPMVLATHHIDALLTATA